MSTRNSGRQFDALRPPTFERGFARNSDGSVLYRAGGTTVLATANLVEGVPPWLEGRGSGWLTAEYMMIPGSTPGRKSRKTDGRSTEIQRLIGRSLRAGVDTTALGPNTLYIDTEILEADGGTRTAAITGAFVALVDALLKKLGAESTSAVIKQSVGAISVGIVDGKELLDLDYSEDSRAEVDLNVVGLGDGGLVEVQGTGEGGTFTRAQLDTLLDLAEKGLRELTELQRLTLGPSWPL